MVRQGDEHSHILLGDLYSSSITIHGWVESVEPLPGNTCTTDNTIRIQYHLSLYA